MRLLERQRALQVESFGSDPQELVGDDLSFFVIWNIAALEHELHEALDELKGWKPWSSRTPKIENRARYIEELVDAMHFLANLLLVAGVTDDELETAYETKRQVNAQRQAEGYSR